MIRIDRFKVRQQMRKVGISTFAELAEILDVSPQAMSAWFAGKGFSSGTLDALCFVFDATPNDILTVENEGLFRPKLESQPELTQQTGPKRHTRRIERVAQRFEQMVATSAAAPEPPQTGVLVREPGR